MIRVATMWMVAVLFANGSAFALAPLECPAGTRLESSVDAERHRSEWCVRTDNGVRHGPQRELRADGTVAILGMNVDGEKHGTARLYDEKGVLLTEMVFEHDRITSDHMTLAGLQRIMAQMNERAHAKNMPTTFRAIDEATVGIDFRFPDASAQTGGEKLAGFRQHVQKTFCGLFDGRTKQLELFRVRVFNAVDTAPQTEFQVKRKDCQGSAAVK
jgi:hypothetical protein